MVSDSPMSDFDKGGKLVFIHLLVLEYSMYFTMCGYQVQLNLP